MKAILEQLEQNGQWGEILYSSNGIHFLVEGGRATGGGGMAAARWMDGNRQSINGTINRTMSKFGDDRKTATTGTGIQNWKSHS